MIIFCYLDYFYSSIWREILFIWPVAFGSNNRPTSQHSGVYLQRVDNICCLQAVMSYSIKTQLFCSVTQALNDCQVERFKHFYCVNISYLHIIDIAMPRVIVEVYYATHKLYRK